MSEDFINQLTLNCLINKNQLEKLNKKICNDKDEIFKKKVQLYKNEILILFTQLLENNSPSDLLSDVHKSFDLFVSKSIYYFETRDDAASDDAASDDAASDDAASDDAASDDAANDDAANDDAASDDAIKKHNWFEEIRLKQQLVIPRKKY
jgi:hypothetical protein